MQYKERSYPRFSACGLNCGLCPRYHTAGASRCPGCAGAGFSEKHPACGVLSCAERRGLEYCCFCEEYPCKKYAGAMDFDSFITHLPMGRDFERAKVEGLQRYRAELDAKVAALETLLSSYDDGRRKSFFCQAVNLLALADVEAVMGALALESRPDGTVKEKASLAARLFQAMADERGVSLKLRKKGKA